MKIGIVSLGGFSSSLIAEECKKYFSVVDNLNLKDFEVHLTNEGIQVTHLKKDLEKYDCLYIRGSFRYALLQRAITRALNQEVYMPIKPSAFTICHDKFLTLLELQKNKIPIPKTYFAATTDLARKILEEDVDYPIIMKAQEGTHGKGVLIAESLKSARTILDILEDFRKPYVIQEFVKMDKASDIRVLVAGDKILTAYKRVASNNDIRANIHSGGKRERHELTPEEKKIAIESARAVKADICGIDIFNCENASVIEINLSPSLRFVTEFNDMNIAEEIAKYLFERTKRFLKRKKRKEKKKLKKMNGNGADSSE